MGKGEIEGMLEGNGYEGIVGGRRWRGKEWS